MSRNLLQHVTTIVVLGALAERSHAQQTVAIAKDVACARCRIELELVATLGATPGDPLPAKPIAFFKDRRGNTYLLFPGALPRVFSPTGAYLGTLGTMGRIPGGFVQATHITQYRGDTLLVYDRAMSRLTLFDGNRRFLRVFPTQDDVFEGFTLPSGELVFSGWFRTPRGIGFPFRREALGAADRARYFGTPSERIELHDRVQSDRRFFASRRNGTYWVSRVAEYVLEEVDTSGRPLRQIRGGAGWFNAARMKPGFQVTPSQPPASLLVSGFEDHHGRLWTTSQVGLATWRQSLGPPRRSPSGQIWYGVVDRTKHSENVIEVLDLSRGVVLARRQVPGHPMHQMWDGTIVSYAPDDRHTPIVKVWRARLVQHSP